MPGPTEFLTSLKKESIDLKTKISSALHSAGKRLHIDIEDLTAGFRSLLDSGAEDSGAEAERQQDEMLLEVVGAERIATWGMMYCGGSQPVVDALKSVQASVGVVLQVEKFDW